MIEKICEECGKTFIGHHKAAYCSEECRAKGIKKKKHQQYLREKAREDNDKKKKEPFVKCKHLDCFYHSRLFNGGLETCDYILKTHEPRNCSVVNCDKYKPREKNEN